MCGCLCLDEPNIHIVVLFVWIAFCALVLVVVDFVDDGGACFSTDGCECKGSSACTDGVCTGAVNEKQLVEGYLTLEIAPLTPQPVVEVVGHRNLCHT